MILLKHKYLHLQILVISELQQLLPFSLHHFYIVTDYLTLGYYCDLGERSMVPVSLILQNIVT